MVRDGYTCETRTLLGKRMNIFIVCKGERGEGRSVHDVRQSFQDAEIAAKLLMDPRDEWELVKSDHQDSPLPCTRAAWEYGCDIIEIQEWRVR